MTVNAWTWLTAISSTRHTPCLQLIYRATRHDFSHYKRGTMLRRRPQARRVGSVEDYLALLEEYTGSPSAWPRTC
jgi:hypothetical protein